MKGIGAVVLVALLATGRSGFCTENDQETFDFITCPNRCLVAPLFGDLVEQTRGNLAQFVKWYVDGEGPKNIIPELKPEKWEAMCSMWKSFHLCLQNCGDETLMISMQKWLASLMTQAGVDFACDREIEENFKCLMNVAQTSLPSCDARCGQYRVASGEAVRSFKEAEAKKSYVGVPPYHKLVTVFSRNVCLFLNCHLKCRTKEILGNCGKVGINATRNALISLGRIAEVVYIGYSMSGEGSGQMPKYAPQCAPDQLVHGFQTGDIPEQEVDQDFDTVHVEL